MEQEIMEQEIMEQEIMEQEIMEQEFKLLNLEAITADALAAEERSPFIPPYADLLPLSDWIRSCRRAGVPFIEAEWGPWIDVRQIYHAIDRSGAFPTVDAAVEWYDQTRRIKTRNGERFMLRWEDCAPGFSKYLATTGKGYTPQWHDLTFDDPRLLDCTVGYKTQLLCFRPWTDAMMHEGYPVEFRVYYGPQGFQGISNYYPQRSLQGLAAETRHPMLLECIRYAGWLAEAWDFPIGFTADFLAQPDGKMIFLEGGPPHNANPSLGPAHPCCFLPGQICGIALTDKNPDKNLDKSLDESGV